MGQIADENKTKQNKTKQNKTKQNKTKQNKTKQNKTKQNKTKQNKTTVRTCHRESGSPLLLDFGIHYSYRLYKNKTTRAVLSGGILPGLLMGHVPGCSNQPRGQRIAPLYCSEQRLCSGRGWLRRVGTGTGGSSPRRTAS